MAYNRQPLRGGVSTYRPGVSNYNGTIGEQRLANSIPGAKTQARGWTPMGTRVFDVVSSNGLHLYESKVGRLSNSQFTRNQISKDKFTLGANRYARGTGKALLPLGLAMDSARLYQSYRNDGDRFGLESRQTASAVAGSWAGALTLGMAGAKGGAALGTLTGGPGIGTTIGGVIGGLVGGVLGAVGGDWAGGFLSRPNNQATPKQNTQSSITSRIPGSIAYLDYSGLSSNAANLGLSRNGATSGGNLASGGW